MQESTQPAYEKNMNTKYWKPKRFHLAIRKSTKTSHWKPKRNPVAISRICGCSCAIPVFPKDFRRDP